MVILLQVQKGAVDVECDKETMVARRCGEPGQVASANSALQSGRSIWNCGDHSLPVVLFFYDFALYLGVFVANLVFIAVYVVVLLLNHRGRYSVARNVLLGNACSQVFVVSFY